MTNLEREVIISQLEDLLSAMKPSERFGTVIAMPSGTAEEGWLYEVLTRNSLDENSPAYIGKEAKDRAISGVLQLPESPEGTSIQTPIHQLNTIDIDGSKYFLTAVMKKKRSFDETSEQSSRVASLDDVRDLMAYKGMINKSATPSVNNPSVMPLTIDTEERAYRFTARPHTAMNYQGLPKNSRIRGIDQVDIGDIYYFSEEKSNISPQSFRSGWHSIEKQHERGVEDDLAKPYGIMKMRNDKHSAVYSPLVRRDAFKDKSEYRRATLSLWKREVKEGYGDRKLFPVRNYPPRDSDYWKEHKDPHRKLKPIDILHQSYLVGRMTEEGVVMGKVKKPMTKKEMKERQKILSGLARRKESLKNKVMIF